MYMLIVFCAVKRNFVVMKNSCTLQSIRKKYFKTKNQLYS